MLWDPYWSFCDWSIWDCFEQSLIFLLCQLTLPSFNTVPSAYSANSARLGIGQKARRKCSLQKKRWVLGTLPCPPRYVAVTYMCCALTTEQIGRATETYVFVEFEYKEEKEGGRGVESVGRGEGGLV